MRLINANALGKHILALTGMFTDEMGFAVPINSVKVAIQLEPTIDAVPVVHARWVDPCINKYGHPCHHCSACRFKASQKDRNFCPNCGAKMDGGAAE